jgi:hypothetical protein
MNSACISTSLRVTVTNEEGDLMESAILIREVYTVILYGIEKPIRLLPSSPVLQNKMEVKRSKKEQAVPMLILQEH